MLLVGAFALQGERLCSQRVSIVEMFGALSQKLDELSVKFASSRNQVRSRVLVDVRKTLISRREHFEKLEDIEASVAQQLGLHDEIQRAFDEIKRIR